MKIALENHYKLKEIENTKKAEYIYDLVNIIEKSFRIASLNNNITVETICLGVPFYSWDYPIEEITPITRKAFLKARLENAKVVFLYSYMNSSLPEKRAFIVKSPKTIFQKLKLKIAISVHNKFL